MHLQSLIDDIINSINILAERALNSVEQGLLNAPPATLGFKAPKSSSAQQTGENPLDPAEQAKNEIESGTHQLETLLCANIDRTFDRFELYVLRNILCVNPVDIRNYIRLTHYEGLDFSASDPAGEDGHGGTTDSDKPTLESVGQLRRKLRESMRLNAMLHAEQERNARLLSDLRGLVGLGGDDANKVKDENADENSAGPFAFLHRQVAQLKDAGADTPLSTTTDFTLSQLQALRALSTSLRTMSPHLQPVSGDEGDSGNRSWRRERLEYVEGATRRHLENVQGLELGKDGEVRDGEWQGEGRKLGKGEVEGLERVVAVLGGEGTAQNSTGDDDDTMDES
jgi:kinetochore protein Mis12/MTW1